MHRIPARSTILSCLGLLTGISAAHAQGDSCSTALPVVSGVYLADGPTSGDGQGGSLSCGAGNDGDWYVYTPSFTGTIVITSCHPLNNQLDDDTYLKVMTGTCGDLVCVGFNDDSGIQGCPGYSFSSTMEVAVTAGVDYYIVWVDTFDDDSFYWELRECAGTVTGVTYMDANSNGIRDADEMHRHALLQIDPGPTYRYAGNDPYSFCSDVGTYTITVPNPPLHHTVVPGSHTYTITEIGDQITGMDFAFQPIPGIHDASVSLWGWNPWIGNNTVLHLNYQNVGTAPADASLTLTLDPLLSYVDATTDASSVNGQVVTWDLGVIAPGSTGSITVTIHTDISAAPNAPVSNTATITTVQDDINGENNSDTHTGICTTSFDPNDKQVDRTVISPEEVVEQVKLEYTIRFQNTGNAPAVNVVIKDSLDADWDLGTFEMLDATHPYTMTLTEEVAIWTFANIFLPDSSTDAAGSIGSFHYRMAPRSELLVGDELTNRADIYFDQNEAVLTNTTVTPVVLASGIDEHSRTTGMQIHPSPGNGLINIRWSLAEVADAQLIVRDALGRIHSTVNLGRLGTFDTRRLDLGQLAPGTYLAQMRGSGTDAYTRFVIER